MSEKEKKPTGRKKAAVREENAANVKLSAKSADEAQEQKNEGEAAEKNGLHSGLSDIEELNSGFSDANGLNSGSAVKAGVKSKKKEGQAPKKKAGEGRASEKTRSGRDERGRFTKENKIGENERFELENAAACKYKEEYADMLIEFFNKPNIEVKSVETYGDDGAVSGHKTMVIPSDYPTFEAFAASLGVVTRTLLNWCEQSRRFADCYARAKEIQRGKLITNTMMGRYNPMFAKFEAINNHGMSDRIVQEQAQEKPFEVNINVVRN